MNSRYLLAGCLILSLGAGCDKTEPRHQDTAASITIPRAMSKGPRSFIDTVPLISGTMWIRRSSLEHGGYQYDTATIARDTIVDGERWILYGSSNESGDIMMERNTPEGLYAHYIDELGHTNMIYLEARYAVAVGDSFRASYSYRKMGYTDTVIEYPDTVTDVWRVSAIDTMVTVPAGTFQFIRVDNYVLDRSGRQVAWRGYELWSSEVGDVAEYYLPPKGSAYLSELFSYRRPKAHGSR